MKQKLLLISLVFSSLALFARSADDGARQSVDAFNQKFTDACLKMDNQATAALWAEDGADLLPGMAPMTGRTKIGEWLNSLTPQMAGAKMLSCTWTGRTFRSTGTSL